MTITNRKNIPFGTDCAIDLRTKIISDTEIPIDAFNFDGEKLDAYNFSLRDCAVELTRLWFTNVEDMVELEEELEEDSLLVFTFNTYQDTLDIPTMATVLYIARQLMTRQ